MVDRFGQRFDTVDTGIGKGIGFMAGRTQNGRAPSCRRRQTVVVVTVPFGLKRVFVILDGVGMKVVMLVEDIHSNTRIVRMAFRTAHFAADGQSGHRLRQYGSVAILCDHFDEGVLIFIAGVVDGNGRNALGDVEIVGRVVVHGFRGGVLCFFARKPHLVLKRYSGEEFVRILPEIALVAAACVDAAVIFGEGLIGDGHPFIDDPG